MNYEITNTRLLESSDKSYIKPYLLLILSLIFIPAAYMLVAAVFIVQLAKKNFKMHLNKLSLLVYAYVLIGLITSRYKLISSFFALLIMLCFYSFQIFSTMDLESIKKLKKLIFIISLLVFMIGLLQYFSPEFSIPSKWVDVNEYNLNKRIYSTFFNPNVFGFFINLVLLVVCEDLSIKKVNLDWTIFIVGIICLILTFSRSSWASLIISLIAASLFNKKYLKYAFIISIAILSFDMFLGIGRVNPAKAATDSSFLYRIEVWKTCIEIIKDHFLSGIGFGTLYKYVGNYSAVVSTKIEHSHNIYIQIFTETGILGFSIFLTIIFNVLRKFKKYLFEGNNKRWITAFAIFIMTLIHGTVDSVALTPQIMMILSMYAGTLNTMSNEQ